MALSSHTVPVDDIISHDTDSMHCICGPTLERDEQENGKRGWIIIHHALRDEVEDDG